jgi:hypothetical protein
MPHDHHHHGPSPDAPIVCNLGVFNASERRRHAALAKKVHGAVTGIREFDDGYALQLAAGKVSVPEAGEWMLLEMKCCPFLQIGLESDGDGLWVRLSGRAGVKEFLRAELKLDAARR